MANLVAARCPTCGAGLKIDVEQEIASCGYCNTSAFVRTNKRPVPSHVQQQRVPVIDTSSRWLLWMVVVVPTLLVVISSAWASFSSLTRPNPAEIPQPSGSEAEVKPPTQPGEAMPYLAVPTREPPPEMKVPPGMKVVEVDGLKVLRPDPATANAPAPRGMREVEVNGLKVLRPAQGSSAIVKLENTAVSSGLETSLVARTIGQGLGRFRLCYAQALALDQNLSATSSVRFVIQADGAVNNLGNMGSAMPGPMKDCVFNAYRNLRFPTPSKGTATVISKLGFSPG